MKHILTIFLIIIACFTALPQSSKAKNGWTYWFYIAGDNYYNAPVYGKDKVVEKDQAYQLYMAVKKQAQSDSDNNYAIFYDPKGSTFKRTNRLLRRLRRRGIGRSPFINTKKHVRFLFVRQGKLVKKSSPWNFETDMTDPKNFKELIIGARKYIGKKALQNSKHLFYYYGEHIASRPSKYPYDHDLGKRSKLVSQMNFKKFFKGLQYFKKYKIPRFQLTIMHSCSMNFHFFKLLRSFTQIVLTSPKGIPRAKLNITSFRGANKNQVSQKFVEHIIHDNPAKDYPFEFVTYTFDEGFEEFCKIFDEFLNNSSNKEFQNAKQGILDQIIKAHNSGKKTKLQNLLHQLNDLFPSGYYLPYTQEYLMQIGDYLEYCAQYCEDEELLEILSEYFEEHPKFQEMYIIF